MARAKAHRRFRRVDSVVCCQQSLAWIKAQTYSNMLFTFIFIIEALLKIIGLGIKGYFTRKGNCFDFFLVLLSLVGFFVNTGVGTNFLRIFRVARVFRLVKALKVSRFPQLHFLIASPSQRSEAPEHRCPVDGGSQRAPD